MESIYRSPLRVYLVLGALSLIGIVSAFQLPISLFPNSSKPVITTCIGSEMAPDAFQRFYGTYLEGSLRQISEGGLDVEKVTASYDPGRSCMTVEFHWGVSPQVALKEVQTRVQSFAGRLPADSRNRVRVWSNQDNSGFLAVSFYSSQRSLTEVYNVIEPLLSPYISKVPDASEVSIYNPQKLQVQVELKPEVMAYFQLTPADVSNVLSRSVESYSGGSLTVGTDSLRIEFPSDMTNLNKLKNLILTTPTGKSVNLSDIAHVDLTIPLDSARIFKTSGASSVILFADPKAGGNVKRMAEDVLEIVKRTEANWPADIKYKVLVDPSEFIRSAVNNVAHEVGLAALLAVFILFLFIGNFKNVITAAIEIPLSMILAFILMKFSNMNLNLISLGGLALSAGMNVDASVVVMENIFRHFEKASADLDRAGRLQLIVKAVNEVRFAVIASTIASLVVFLPLAFTSELTYAILGDLAKAVVFSHGFSAIVALILVPTIRLQMMAKGKFHETAAPAERFLIFVENAYAKSLKTFLDRNMLKVGSYAFLGLLLIVLLTLVVPKLPREILGKPDTDWIMLGINTQGNTVMRQMEGQAEVVEADMMAALGNKATYTFSQINRPNAAWIMARLKDKKDMKPMLKMLEEKFTNSPFMYYWMDSWNPAELPVPNPPDLKISVRGNDINSMAMMARDISTELQEKKILPRISTTPNASVEQSIVVHPNWGLWPGLIKSGARLYPSDLADLARTATNGKYVANVTIDNQDTEIYLRFPKDFVGTPEELGSLPIGLNKKIVPLKALATVTRESVPPILYKENGRQTFIVTGQKNKNDDEAAAKEISVKDMEKFLEPFKVKANKEASPPLITVEDPKLELTTALKQLATAVSLSIGLIFLTMIFQFGGVMNSLLVLVAIPLGMIGVSLSLYVFKSTLSLNSILGVILLNGISVANSIILVDFLQRAVKEGKAPRIAAIEVARMRLRPILMTSLTTALGMIPVAIGMGEGGRILQPLGIAVTGGLAFSMVTTLFIVPSLQVAWLEWREKHLSVPKGAAGLARSSTTSLVLIGIGVGTLALGLLTNPVKAFAKEPLSFAAAYQTILGRNLNVKNQQLTVDISEAKYFGRVMTFTPSLAGKITQAQAGEPFGSANQAYGYLSFNLLRFGGDLAGLAAARFGRVREQSNLAVSWTKAEEDALTTLGTFIEQYFEVNQAHRMLDIKEESYRVGKERFQRGMLPLQELEKIGIDVDNLRARLNDLENRFREAMAALASSLGVDFSDPNDTFENDAGFGKTKDSVNLAVKLPVVPEWPWKSKITNDKELSRRNWSWEDRPDWRAAQSDVAFNQSLTTQLNRVLWPSLDLDMKYGIADLSNSGNRDWSTNLTLTIPISDQWRSATAYKIQTYTELVSNNNLEQLKRQIPESIEALKKEFETAKESALRRDQTVQRSRKLLDDSLLRFKMGRASVNDLFLDQSRLYDAEFLAVHGWNNSHISYMKLCHAYGYRINSAGDCVSRW